MKVGVIGAKGDLGGQVVQMLLSAGHEVMECDTTCDESPTIDDVMRECQIVHFCVSIAQFKSDIVAKNTIVVLHDSVMQTSITSARLFINATVWVVHMLMNATNAVIFASEMSSNETEYHFRALGCTTHSMTAREHDVLMARSQAPFALLIQVLHIPLKQYAADGLLTPSGELLVKALDERALTWTPQTIKSILSNPSIEDVIDEMREVYARSTS